jgi:hypothetical protein
MAEINVSQYLPAKNEGSHGNTTVRMINILVKIQTRHLQKQVNITALTF